MQKYDYGEKEEIRRNESIKHEDLQIQIQHHHGLGSLCGFSYSLLVRF